MFNLIHASDSAGSFAREILLFDKLKANAQQRRMP